MQTSDQYNRQTGTNIGPVQTSDGYIYKENGRNLVKFERKDNCYESYNLEFQKMPPRGFESSLKKSQKSSAFTGEKSNISFVSRLNLFTRKWQCPKII